MGEGGTNIARVQNLQIHIVVIWNNTVVVYMFGIYSPKLQNAVYWVGVSPHVKYRDCAVVCLM